MAQVFNEAEIQQHIQNMQVGDRFITKSRVITRTDLELYAISTGDTHPMFLSEEEAKAAGWKSQLVPGLLTFSIAVGLLIQSGFIGDVKAFLGADRVRFNSPVYPYDSISVEAEVLSKRQTKSGDWICSYKWIVRNQNGVAVAEGENT